VIRRRAEAEPTETSDAGAAVPVRKPAPVGEAALVTLPAPSAMLLSPLAMASWPMATLLAPMAWLSAPVLLAWKYFVPVL
jgi:hypothetical protein